MNQLEKAQKQLESVDIATRIENGTLYVVIDEMCLELSEFEINFQAGLYDEEN